MKISKINIGDKFYNLTVIKTLIRGHHFKNKGHINLCKCTCGNEVLVPSTYLKTGRSKNCKECSFRNRELNKLQITQIDQVFKRLVLDRCKKNNIEVTINSKQYENIGKQNCYYCGNSPQKTQRFSNRKYVNTEPMYLNGLDRLDNNKGYILENCVSCCTSCNYSKHILNENEFKEKIIKIYNNMNLKKENFCPHAS